jgi:hypothetical protein
MKGVKINLFDVDSMQKKNPKTIPDTIQSSQRKLSVSIVTTRKPEHFAEEKLMI